MEICALASGSSGNCFYIGTETSAVLVDAGITAKQIVERSAKVRLDPSKIKAILITHEHSDHIQGADVLARKLNIPIFATKNTLKNRFICSNPDLLKIIPSGNKLKIDDLTIEPFSKSHGAADPISFTISKDKRVSIITDAGYVCSNIKKHVSEADFLCIESNHDEEMLVKGPYSPFLKKWIKSDKGHLSNLQAGECIRDYSSKRLKKVILSHLSKTNNTPFLALKTVRQLISEAPHMPSIEVSLRESPTQVFKI